MRALRSSSIAALLAALPASALAHSTAEHTGEAARLGWTFEPWVVIPMAISTLLYAAGVSRMWRHAGIGRGIRFAQCVAFAAAQLVLVGALISPLDALGSHLFSAHMMQHEMLMLIAAPLFVVSKPLAAWSWAFPRSARSGLPELTHRGAVKAPWQAITHPLSAWLLHAFALWIWHLPALFALALANEGWHALQHASFLSTALLFWWSAIGVDLRGARRGIALASLFTTMLHTGALGALLTFGPRPWYPAYASTTAAFGLDPLEDQQLGGLVMWVPGGLAYVVAALAIVGRYLGGASRRQQPALSAAR